MIHLRVERSPVHQFLAGIAGLVLVLAALDVVWIHQVSSAPAENTDGTLTTRGVTQRRSDILWGSVLLVGGGVVLIAAVVGLTRRRPVLEMTDEAFGLQLGSPFRRGADAIVRIPWDDIVMVRSGTDEGDAFPRTRVLIVKVVDPSQLPSEPWGAEWDGDELRIDADSWELPAEEVSLRAQLLIRRRSAPTEPA